MLRKGDVFAGYAIQRVLGQGGMGTVYLAKHPRLPRLTALKLLNPELYSDTEIRGRFEREADLVARLDHPNIVTVYDRGAEDEQLWISMQFVPGADASCADVNVLAPGRAVQIVGDTAKALDFAHANGVLHRDVKPANILLAKAPIGQPERVLLTDFGIAGVRDSDTTLSSAGSITATLAYAAPEQLLGLPLDDRADQYALACTLFWMLTGVGPYSGGNPAAVINGHLYGPVPSVCHTRPGIPPALEGVLARALAKRSTDRFGSCSEFAAAARWALSSSGPQYPHPPNGSAHTAHPAPGRPPVGTTPPHHAPTNHLPPHPASQHGPPSHHAAPYGLPPHHAAPHHAPQQPAWASPTQPRAAPTHTASPATQQQSTPPHPTPLQATTAYTAHPQAVSPHVVSPTAQQFTPPQATTAYAAHPQSEPPRRASPAAHRPVPMPSETRAPQDNSVPADHSAPHGTENSPQAVVMPTSLTSPTPSAPHSTEVSPAQPGQAGNAMAAGAVGTPPSSAAPRMPLPPRRNPRPGTIALPDIRARPARSTPPDSARRGGRQPPEPPPPP
ncbi:protein kinase domain-containing protein [Nocardia sp. NBC_01009]|uniref:serine/threonine-protein kinase n=1 Tax=Nocardia sp. NBC_01009 TaxID=2975996 RepID=UPI0038632A55|nr:protein kinase [Nocardia sp. NBC_01009]